MTDVWERFKYRSAVLYDGIVRLALEAEEGARWLEILARVDPENRWAERTIEGAIRDLVVVGMVSVSGSPARGRRLDSRRVRVTPIGKAVLEGVEVPIPWTSTLGLGGVVTSWADLVDEQ